MTDSQQVQFNELLERSAALHDAFARITQRDHLPARTARGEEIALLSQIADETTKVADEIAALLAAMIDPKCETQSLPVCLHVGIDPVSI